jgi:hypothetical protein
MTVRNSRGYDGKPSTAEVYTPLSVYRQEVSVGLEGKQARKFGNSVSLKKSTPPWP